ncbi:MAG: HlyD family efflux transporter periplasmic adaptor subunit [Planctomycetales bacterium]|nr:HlyD family efflux transporter periplasmic adaptor subunit [Planctomycetales bacterium]
MSPVITSIVLAAASVGQASDPNVIDNCSLYAIWANEVPAKEGGVITDLLIQEGQNVTADQVIAQIDEKDAKLAFKVAAMKWKAAKVQAESDVSVQAAIKQRDLYQIELQRKLQVVARVPDAVSKTEIRELEYRRDRGILEIEAAEHQMKVAIADEQAAMSEAQRAEAMIENRKVKSPVEGFVSQIIRRNGTWVSPGEPVAYIVQMDKLRVEMPVDYDDHPQSSLMGRRVEVIVDTGSGGSETASGVVGFTDVTIDKRSGLYRAWIEIENRKLSSGQWLFTPGMKATVHLK